MTKNNEYDATHKSEINAALAFTQSLAVIVKWHQHPGMRNFGLKIQLYDYN